MACFLLFSVMFRRETAGKVRETAAPAVIAPFP